MKVAFVLNSTLTTGGASKSFLSMLAGLMSIGVIPFVILPDRNGLYNIINKLDVKTFVLTYRESTYPPYDKTIVDILLFLPRLFGRIYVNWRATSKLKKIFKEEMPDIVHTNVSVVNIGFKAAKKLGIPHIYHIREYGDLDFNRHYFPLHGYFAQQLDMQKSYSICITEDIQKHYQQAGKSTSRVVYNGIMSRRDILPSNMGKYFLFMGRIEPAKGLDFLLQAYKKYFENTTNPLPLHIAGAAYDNNYMKYINRCIKEANIGNNILFLGEIKEIESAIHNAKAIIIPSCFEGFGRVMPEAMFHGCLAIGRNTGGTKEQMDNGKCLTGKEIALSFTTVEQLAEQLLAVSKTPAKDLDPIRERAFQTVNTLYTTEALVENVYQFYKDIINESNT